MPHIVVSSLSRLAETAEAHGASHMVTLINRGTPVTRPAGIAADNHLFLAFNDIVEPIAGMTPPGEAHVRDLIDFTADWDRASPILIHCFAGISRSTAAAYITALALNPALDETHLARHLRTASPSATPNARLVAIADAVLGREGRMVDAIAGIGRGADAFEGEPFVVPLELG
ncbi:MAG: tyrosine protein phosphatase [Brucellaceae bacterium]|nr:tyrosine protein phosphatase [Brucellaceae bacterium]